MADHQPDPTATRARDLVKRDFTASAPNRLWVGDFTYLRCWEGVVYFSFVIDVFSRTIVGWQLAVHMRTDLVLDALRIALGLREPGADFELVAHTDAGSQYTSCDYTQVLDDHEVLASIGTVGDALDNALAESFVDSYKTELIADRVWRTRQQLELATVEWVAWFNHERLHEALGDIPPVEFEQHHALQLALQSPVSLNGSVAAIAPRAAEQAYNASTRDAQRRFRLRPPDRLRERFGPPSATRSGRGTGRPAMKASPVASPTGSFRSDTHRLKEENLQTQSPWNPVRLTVVAEVEHANSNSSSGLTSRATLSFAWSSQTRSGA